ncbi:MAG: SIMPL domain-containing protein [Terriglobales bacterium]
MRAGGEAMTNVGRLAMMAALLGAMAAGQQPQQQMRQPARVQVSAEGQYQAAPDTAVVSLAASGQDASLKRAYAQAQAQAEQVRALLRQQGFPPEAVRWSSYEVQPEMDYKTRRVASYAVSTTAALEVRDFAKIAALVDAAGAAGLSALRDISFELKDQAPARQAAIADAYRQVRAEAEAVARAAGQQLGELVSVTVNVNPQPVIMRRMAGMNALAAAAPAPTEGFTPSLITVTASVTAEYRMKP